MNNKNRSKEVLLLEIESLNERVKYLEKLDSRKESVEIKEIEGSLRIHNQVLNNMDEAIYIFGVKDGFLKYFNPATIKTFGYSSDELKNIYIYDLFDPGVKESNEYENEILEQIKKTDRWVGEFKGRKKDGTFFIGKVSLTLFDHPSFGEVLIVVHLDNSELDIAVKKIQHHYELTRHLDSAFITTNLDDEIVSWSKYAEELLLWKKDEVLGKKLIEIIVSQDNREEHLVSLYNIKGTDCCELESELIRKDGSIFFSHMICTNYFDQENSQIGYVRKIHDISVRVKAIHDAEQSENKYRELADLLPQIVYEVDNKGVLTYINQKGYEVFGYTKADFEKGVNVIENLVPRDRKRAGKAIKNAIRGIYDKDNEYTGIKSNGNEFKILIYANPIVENNIVTGLRGVIVDISSLKHVEQKLAESEDRFIKVMEQSPSVLEVYSLDGLQISVNKAYEELWGFPASQTLFKFNILKSQEVKDTGLIEYVNKAYNGETVTVPEYLFDPRGNTESDGAGRVRWLSTKIYPLRDTEGKVYNIVVTHEDVTDRRKAEQKLILSQERFNLAVNASKDGLYDWNLLTNEIYYSPGWKKMLGYQPDELPDDFSIWEKLTKPEDAKRSWEMQNEMITKKRDSFKMEFQMKHKDGHWVDILSRAEAIFNDEGAATRIVGTHVDISERKKFEDSLKEYKAIFDNSINEIFVFNADSLKIIRVNDAALNNLGYSIEELKNMTPVDIKPEIREKEFLEILEPLKNKTKKKVVFQTLHERKDKSLYPVEPHVQIMDTDSGPVFTAILLDITERKKAEEELKKYQEELEGLVEKRTKKLIATNNELDEMLKVFVGRELKIQELQNELSKHRK